MRLARSLWPRTGGDPGHSARISVHGPDSGALVWQCALGPAATGRHQRFHGLVLSEDGTLRVVAGGHLSCVARDGGVRWRDDEPCVAPPVALAGGDTLVIHRPPLDPEEDFAPPHFDVLDPQGVRVRRMTADFSPDDSGISPCLVPGEHEDVLIATSPGGEVYRREEDRWVELGAFGYDILPPAVFADHSLGIAGYAGHGYCRVGLDGKVRWRSGFSEADLLVTVSAAQLSAVGSVNDARSEIYTPEGQRLGGYDQPAIFSEHLDGGWVALSDGAVARLTSDGTVLWQMPLNVKRGWGGVQAITDARGHVYVPSEDGVTALSAAGETLFSTALGGPALAMAMVAEGHLAVLCGNQVYVLH
jgi:hypothetical protein